MNKLIFKKDYLWEETHLLKKNIDKLLKDELNPLFEGKIRVLIVHVKDKEDDIKTQDQESF